MKQNKTEKERSRMMSKNSDSQETYWFSIQLKPVGSMCNLRCKYCYAKPHLTTKETMSKEMLEHIVKNCLQQNFSQPTFSWHGGEPVLVGYDFFQYTMILIEQYRRSGQ